MLRWRLLSTSGALLWIYHCIGLLPLTGFSSALLHDNQGIGLIDSMSLSCWMAAATLRLTGSEYIIRNSLLRSSSSRLFFSSTASEPLKDSERKNVAIVGAGAVGGYYGARLWEAGHNVTFYMRGENLQVCTRQGLNVTSVDGDLHIPANKLVTCTDTSKVVANNDNKMDWVLVALKSSSLEAVPDLIYPLLSPDTRVLAIMNGLVDDDLIRLLKEKSGENAEVDDAPLECCRALYGGMAFICSNRIEPGHIDHSFAGLLAAGVACSRTEDSPEVDQTAFEQLWAPTKVTTAYEPCLLRGRWKKNIWNLPFNGISVAMGGITIDRVVQDPDLRRLADMLMDETIAVANAALEEKYGESGFDALGVTEKKLMMGLSDNMGLYKTSTMLDLVERRPMEVQYLFGKPLEYADKLGVPVPHLETMVAQIRAFQRFHNLF